MESAVGINDEASSGDGFLVPVLGDPELLGNFYVAVTLLKPNEETGRIFRLGIDTGSNVTYLPCEGCTSDSCGPLGVDRHVNIDHQAEIIRCSDDICPTKNQGCDFTMLGNPDICMFDEKLRNGRAVSGTYVSSTLNLSGFHVNVPIGCATNIKREGGHDFADGILGMDYFSPIWRDVKAWSLCVSPAGFFGGSIEFHSKYSRSGTDIWIPFQNSAETEHSDNLTQPEFLSGNRLLLNESIPLLVGEFPIESNDADELHAVIDTGTNATWIPTTLFVSVRTALEQFCKQDDMCGDIPQQKSNPASLGCFDFGSSDFLKSYRGNPELAEAMFKRFPILNFQMPASSTASGAHQYNFTVSPIEYFYQYNASTHCIGIMNDASNMYEGDIVFGINAIRGKRLTFDWHGDDPGMLIQTCTVSELLPVFHTDYTSLSSVVWGKVDFVSFIGGWMAGVLLSISLAWVLRYFFCSLKPKYQILSDNENDSEKPNRARVLDMKPLQRTLSLQSIDIDSQSLPGDPWSAGTEAMFAE